MIMAAALLTLSLFASCNKNSNGTNGTVTSFTAGIEQNAPSTRTYLSNWDIFWSENDAIKVVNNSGQQATFTLDAEGAGTQTASFTTEDTFNDDPDFIGAYPTTAIINNGEVSFNLPQTQTITETGTFANVSMPMVSHSDNTNLLFKNVLGGICFPLKGSFQVSKIVLTAVDTDDMLWGQMTTGWSDDAPTVASLTDGSNAITLECATPVQLNTTTAEEFYIMVPPTMLEKGFTIQVYEGTAVKYEQTVDWTSAPQTGFIPRNLVRVANELNIDMFNIVATCSPEVGGTVSGAGAYRSGDNCTLSVTPATNYNFLGWKKDGATDYYSTEPSISFTVTENASFVAYFDAPLTVTVIADASNGGTVTGGGTYHVGDECTITATPNSGWRFMGWKETGSETILSTETSYTFTVTGDASYTALFSSLTVTTTSPTYIDIHSATSGGTIQTQGSTTITERGVCYATNNNPTLDGDYAVSTATSNTYTAEMSGMTKDVVYWVRAYVKEANGAVTYGEAIPFATRKDYANDYNGRLPFGYSISASRTVNFSMGNLYYMGADGGYWKFADYQFEYLNTDQANENANINRDKFAFATSNQAHGSLSPQPWSSGNGGNNRYYMNHFYAYHDNSGHWNHTLRESLGTADWGYNAIQNGGNTENYGWFTMNGPEGFSNTGGEWNYLLNSRSGNRYAMAQLNVRNNQTVKGMLIFPDGFTFPTQYYAYNLTCNSAAGYTNILNEAQWSILEKYGVAFLPAAGSRQTTGTWVYTEEVWYNNRWVTCPMPNEAYAEGPLAMINMGTEMFYWSGAPCNWGSGGPVSYPNGYTCYNSDLRWMSCWALNYSPSDGLDLYNDASREWGLSVRLVRDAE